MNRKERRAGAAGGRPAGFDPAAATLAQGVQLHQAGRMAEAAALYHQALQIHPGHPDALHLLGMLACQQGRFADAVDLITQATAANGRVPDYHANLGFALQNLGRPAEAEAACRRALKLRPGFPEAANTLGNALLAQGRRDEAVRAYREALRGRSDYTEAHGNLGAALRAAGKPEEAEPHLRQALARNPGMIEARVALALALHDRGRVEEAVEVLRPALAQRPGHPPVLVALAGMLQRACKTAEAEAAFQRVIAVEPADAELWNSYGPLLRGLDRLEAAGRAHERAVRVAPAMPEALTNLGNIRHFQGRPEEAAALHRRALDLRADYADAHANLGFALGDLGDAAASEAAFGRALDLDPELGVAALNRALLRLKAGRLAEGWADYARRFVSRGHPQGITRPMPEWRGEDLTGKRILVWREQGLGDELMFASCYPDLIARAGHVVIECDRRLVPLFQRSFPAATVRAVTGDPLDADVHVAAGSLPGLLRPNLAAFPAGPSWLMADPGRAAAWRARLAERGPGPTVGIAWTSWKIDHTRRNAYTELGQWAPVLRVPGATFVSVQYDGRYDEIAEAERRFGVPIASFPETDLANDLEEAAALTAALDLVISVASAPGELAGALGVPVWRVAARDWTQLGSAARPWYPSQRPCPPRSGEGLGDVLARLAKELARAAAEAR
ncbi:MAG TPA: tetratricopeptide repeat protein [Azospirillum sp.]|nr:tetratricopeptide repeat protein [Azospirillum sp.]